MEEGQVREEGSSTGAMPRRGSMSDVEQKQRRASIQSIMTNPNLTPLEKRRSIQSLMDGRRASVDNGSNPANNPYLAYKASLLRAKLAAEEKSDEDSDADASMGNGEAAASDDGRRWGQDGGDDKDEDDDEMMDADEDDADGHPHDDAHASDANRSHLDAPHPSSNKKKSHPYSAKTTAVPAIAAMAYAGKASSDKKPKRRNSLDINKRAVETSPPCSHYRRNCHIVSPCCGATFGCRICHDDCPVLPPVFKSDNEEMMGAEGAMESGGGEAGGGGRRKYQRVLRTSSMPTSFPSAAGPPEHHNIDRFAIREVICRQCFTKQGSKTNRCINCHVQFGEYHCAICNLWMSNEERPYHCPDCGFCRVGGGENFRHCQDCGMCIDKQLFDHHNCKVGKYMANCPVCYEDLFSSRDASHELPCGHAIHWHCFRELASHDSRCPICKKTAETHERMKPTWDAMAVGIALQPVPPELAKVVTIKCNDCEVVQQNRSWHFLGVQCRGCESFNTVVERITMMGTEAHEFLLREDPPARVPHRRASVGAPPAGYRPPNRQH